MYKHLEICITIIQYVCTHLANDIGTNQSLIYVEITSTKLSLMGSFNI